MNKRVLVILMIGVLISANAVVLLSDIARDVSSVGQNGQEKIKATHDPIKIDSDNDFTSANGVVDGDGSFSHPYVISGWKIYGHYPDYGIYIANTTKNFTIANCDISNNDGIFISNAHAEMIKIMYTNLTTIYGSGITLENGYIKDYLFIKGNDIDSANFGDGIRIHNFATLSGGYIEIGDDMYGALGNRVHSSRDAGINVTNAGLTYVEKNMIYQNGVGIFVNHMGGHMYVINNGISTNTNEGIRISHSHDVYINNNVFYKNYGSTNDYDPSHPQATEYASKDIYWGGSNSGNFWYDWAMKNESNYDPQHNNFVIPWKYPIVNTTDHGKVENYDNYPVKGVHHDPIWMDWKENGENDTKTFNIDTGVVGVDDNGFYVISGWEIDGNKGGTPQGYGVVLNDSFWGGGSIRRYITMDGLLIHNVSSAGSDTLHAGNGLIVNNTDYGYIKIYNVTVYKCANYGMAIAGGSGYYRAILVSNSYIHNNIAGIAILEGGSTEYPDVHIENNTIDSNSHAGIYADYLLTAKMEYNRISKNDIGISLEHLPSDKYYSSTIRHNSFYKNTRWGVRAKSGNVNVSYNIFYENYGSGSIYDASHPQAYSDYYNVTFYRNFYYDWVNNNCTNDENGDDIIDYPYPIDGSANNRDSQPVKWIPYGNGIHIEGDDVNYTPYHGIKYGIIGGEGTSGEPYLIAGLNFILGDVYVGKNSKFFTIRNINVTGWSDFAIRISHMSSSVKIENTKITDSSSGGIIVEYTPYFLIQHNEITGVDYGSGIALYNNPAGWGIVKYNRIYNNKNSGTPVSGINVSFYDNLASGLGLYIMYNQIFGNNHGISIYDSSNVYVHHNGFAYNDIGVGIYLSNGNIIYDNIFYSNHNYDAYDNGNNNWNYTSGDGSGNYWYDWAMKNDTNDQNHDWFVDYPYHIAGGNSVDEHPYLFIPHSPVRIERICDFTWDNGIIGGDGTSEYPYVFAGWRINGKNAGAGIYIGNVSKQIYLRVDGLYINSTSGGSGVYYSNSAIDVYGFHGASFEILNLRAEHNAGDGIYAYHSSSITVENAKLTYNAHGMKFYDCDYVLVEGSNVSHSTYSGIVVQNSHYIGFNNNTFYRNSNHGLYISSSYSLTNSKYKIYGNTFRLNAKYGVYLTSTHGYLIYHNIFDRNNGASGDGTYDSSHIQAYDDGAKYDNLWNTTSEGNCWSDYTGTGAYSIDGGASEDEHPGCGFVPELNPGILVLFILGAMAMALRRRH